MSAAALAAAAAPALLVSNADAQQVSVPMRDARGAQEEAVGLAAANVSSDHLVVVFYGDNQDAFVATREAVRTAISQGLPLRGLIVADARAPQMVNGYNIAGTGQEIAFYADGQRTATIRNPNSEVGAAVLDQLRQDHRNIIVPRRNRAAPSAPQQ